MRRLAVAGLSIALLGVVACKRESEPEPPLVKTPEVLQLEKDAERGDREAQYSLGIRYFKGDGELLDIPKAIEWFQKAADQGLDNAQYTMGFLHMKGDIVPQSRSKAMELFTKAAEQGHEESRYRLGALHTASGGALQPDHVQAYAWLSLVAEGEVRALRAIHQIERKMSSQEIEGARAIAEQIRRRTGKPERPVSPLEPPEELGGLSSSVAE